MSSFNFGGPVMSETVPDETPAQRENRDVAQMGSDDSYTAVSGGSVRDGSAGTLVSTAATATGGRANRDFYQQGGDDSLAYNPADWTNPTETVDADGRIDRLYVDPATGISALDSDGTKGDLFDELKAGPTIY